MTTTPRRNRSRVSITIDIYDEPLITVLIWAHHSAHNLTDQLWEHGVLAHVAGVDIDPHPTLSR